MHRHGVAAVVTHDAFRNPRCAGRIQNVERISGGDADAVGRLRCRKPFGPVVVATGVEFRRMLVALQDNAGLGLVLRQRDCVVQKRLVLDDTAGLDSAGCRQNDPGLCVIDTRRELTRSKPPEDH